MNYTYIWHDDRYKFKFLVREIPVRGRDLKANVTDLAFSYKKKHTFCIKVYIAILSRPFDWFH